MGKSLYYNAVVRPAARRARRVVTGSAHARAEILEWSGLPEDRVTAVQHGVSPAFFPDGDLFEPGYAYLLYVGNSKPHKNVDGLIRGLAAARQAIDVDLVLVGTEERLTQAWAQQHGVAQHVHTMMILTDEQLASVYRSAQALVLPSRNEGFGLPVIEAMACGAPVIASNRSAVPEAAGNAAILVDATDSAALAGAIREVCESTALRADLRMRGLARVQGCTWERTAEQVERILEESL
jgi:glycosyltransferase involved in cell wall biosynthesis